MKFLLLSVFGFFTTQVHGHHLDGTYYEKGGCGRIVISEGTRVYSRSGEAFESFTMKVGRKNSKNCIVKFVPAQYQLYVKVIDPLLSRGRAYVREKGHGAPRLAERVAFVESHLSKQEMLLQFVPDWGMKHRFDYSSNPNQKDQ